MQTNENKIQFDITYDYLWKFVSVRNFVNKLAGKNEFVDKFIWFQKFIDFYKKQSFMSVSQNGYHAHRINDKDVMNLIKPIIKEQYGDCRNFETIWNESFNESNFWQLGMPKGLRVFGTFHGNIFRLLFFDFYHLIYPGEKHNDKPMIKHNNYSAYYKENENNG